MTDLVSFSALATAAYCPRQLYYRRRDPDRPDPPAAVESTRDLAFRYPAILDGALDPAPRGAVSSRTYRRHLRRARERLDRWPSLCDPAERDVLLTGRDCRGRVQKVVGGDPPLPSLVVTGDPPDDGVWDPQAVRAVAAAKALAWELERPVERAFVEYAAHGVVRTLDLTARRTGRYRRVLRTVREMDGPPARTANRSKCRACADRERCGVRTRSLRSLLSQD